MVYIEMRRIVLLTPVPLREPIIDHSISNVLATIPFHMAALRPSSPSVPIYPPFRSRNQPTSYSLHHLALSPLTHFGPLVESCTSPRQRMHPSARAISSPEHTTPSALPKDPGHDCGTLDLIFALSGLGDVQGDGDGGDGFPDQDEDALGAQGWLDVVRE
jgi:hypothetical protein